MLTDKPQIEIEISPRDRAITYAVIPPHCIQKNCHSAVEFFLGVEEHLDGGATISFFCLDCISKLWARWSSVPMKWKEHFQDMSPVCWRDLDALVRDVAETDCKFPSRLSLKCQSEEPCSRKGENILYDTKFLVPLMVICNQCMKKFVESMAGAFITHA